MLTVRRSPLAAAGMAAVVAAGTVVLTATPPDLPAPRVSTTIAVTLADHECVGEFCQGTFYWWPDLKAIQENGGLVATLTEAIEYLLFPPVEPLVESQQTYPPSARGTGVVTAALSNPLPAMQQVARNWADYVSSITATSGLAGLAPVLERILANASAVAAVLAQSIPTAFAEAEARFAAVLEAAAQATTNVVKAFADPNPVAAVGDAFRKGFVGPLGVDGKVTSSLPGTVLATTIGPGIGNYGESGYISSWAVQRQETQARLVQALGGSPVVPAAARPHSAATIQTSVRPAVAATTNHRTVRRTADAAH